MAMGLSVVLYITFLTAYYMPSKAVVVTVDSFGEAHIEMILLLIVIPLILLGVLFAYEDL